MEELLKRLPRGTKLRVLFEYDTLVDRDEGIIEVVIADERSLFARGPRGGELPWSNPGFSVQVCDWGFAVVRADKGAYIYEFI